MRPLPTLVYAAVLGPDPGPDKHLVRLTSRGIHAVRRD